MDWEHLSVGLGGSTRWRIAVEKVNRLGLRDGVTDSVKTQLARFFAHCAFCVEHHVPSPDSIRVFDGRVFLGWRMPRGNVELECGEDGPFVGCVVAGAKAWGTYGLRATCRRVWSLLETRR